MKDAADETTGGAAGIEPTPAAGPNADASQGPAAGIAKPQALSWWRMLRNLLAPDPRLCTLCDGKGRLTHAQHGQRWTYRCVACEGRGMIYGTTPSVHAIKADVRATYRDRERGTTFASEAVATYRGNRPAAGGDWLELGEGAAGERTAAHCRGAPAAGAWRGILVTDGPIQPGDRLQALVETKTAMRWLRPDAGFLERMEPADASTADKAEASGD